MRTFLAFELSELEKDRIYPKIEDYSARKANVNWVSYSNLHITLQFIGDTNPKDVDRILSETQSAFEMIHPFQIISQGVELVPQRKPRLIWNHYQTEDINIFKSYRRLQYALQELGYEVDARKLKLHCTLGRVKYELPAELIQQILREKCSSEKSTISQITLYESKLRREGPLYIPLETINLSSNF
jgi:2'-5' RNA ligase